ncbi:hypothetical protein [Thiohalorhabdus methylotrophus]|uniref:DUF2628 domain-containing protein n=1 Tax=Thiohalorhabdus methylotrophus TaxID=3242694 RepID=A0ABV4TT39_9GAMM
MAMKIFDVYHHPEHGLRSVKQGFCWPAFLGNGLWALRRGMAGLGAGLLVAVLTLAGTVAAAVLLEAYGAAAGAGLAAMAMLSFAGRRANHWWRLTLRREGFYRLCTVDGHTSTAAAAQVAPPEPEPDRSESAPTIMDRE